MKLIPNVKNTFKEKDTINHGLFWECVGMIKDNDTLIRSNTDES